MLEALECARVQGLGLGLGEPALSLIEAAQVVDGLERRCVVRPEASSLPCSAREYRRRGGVLENGFGRQRHRPLLKWLAHKEVATEGKASVGPFVVLSVGD